jgi:hypothetical protein
MAYLKIRFLFFSSFGPPQADDPESSDFAINYYMKTKNYELAI